MTVSTAPTPLSYSGNGSTTAFPITWKYNAKSHVVATLRSSSGTETVWALTTNYTLTDPGDSGTLTAVVAPASGETLVITLEPPNTQSTDLPVGGNFPSSSVEDGFDLSAQRDAYLLSLINRCLRVPKTDTESGSDLQVPIESSRASKFLAFDANGNPIAAAGTSSDLGPVTAFVNTLLDDANSDTFIQTIVASLTAETSPATDDVIIFGDTSEGKGNKMTFANFIKLLTEANNTYSGILTYTAQQRWAKGADVASANALSLGTDGNYFDITGTTAITSIGALGAGTVVRLHFDGALTLTHHATDLILPGAANITTTAGDEAEFVEYASGDWRCVSYTKTNGNATVIPAGSVVQFATTGLTSAVATGTTQTPVDDTIPQNTEGTEFMTVSITPRNTNNKLVIEVIAQIALNDITVGTGAAHLHQDSTANALAAVADYFPIVNVPKIIVLRHTMTAGTTSSTTFKFRFGVHAGGVTYTFNGASGARLLGGVSGSIMNVYELTV